MSFILDALKKSDSDRQRKSQPESAFVATGPNTAPNSRWLWLVGVLLVVNVVVLSVVLLRPAGQSGEPAATVPLQAESTSAQAPSTFKELVSEAKRSQTAADRELSSAATATTTEPPATVDAPVPVSAPETAARSNEPSTTTVAYKTFNEVRAEGSVQLPDLHLDLHVYDEAPADRFVFVNMSKYKENATLGEGPRVTEIVPEGVILQHGGVQFLLPRE